MTDIASRLRFAGLALYRMGRLLYRVWRSEKKQIKASNPWTDTAEANFIISLNSELEKCEQFQKRKADELLVRIEMLEREGGGFG